MIQKNDNQPIYIQVFNYILSEYKSGRLKPGQQLPSENELSKTLGISRVSVRNGYDKLDKSNIISKVKGKGTFLSANIDNNLDLLASHYKVVTKTIGVIFPEFDDFFPKILSGIEQEANLNGYSINIALNSTEQKEKQSIENLIGNGVDGIIINPNRFTNAQKNYTKLIESTIPYVSIGKPLDMIRSDAVYTDDIFGTYNAIQTINELGYKNVIHITSSKSEKEAFYERSKGFVEGMKYFYNEYNPVIIDIENDNWALLLQDGLQLTSRTALYLVDDIIAPKIYQQVYKWNYRIPEDIGVLGTNNSSICEKLEVSLSSISHKQELEGISAFNLLLSRMNGSKDSESVKHIILDTKLIRRDSL